MPEAYWNGYEGTCCKGTVYQSKEGVYECCEDTITGGNYYYSHPYGQSVCSIENAAPNGDTKTCCPRYNSIVSGEVTPAKAYSYNGTSTGADESVACCYGKPFHESNNGESAKYYNCCPEDWCNDGGYYGDYGYCWDEDWTSVDSSSKATSLEKDGYDCYEYDENYWECYRSIDRSDEGIKGKITPIQGVPSGQQTETCCADTYYSYKEKENGGYEYTKRSLTGAVWYTYCPWGCYSSGQCCYGTIFEQTPDKSQNNHMACCNTWDGYGIQTVKGKPPRTKPNKLCCGSYEDQDGTIRIGEAYWDGSESRCCNGVAYPNPNDNDTYHCCTAYKNSSSGKYDFKTQECRYEDDDASIKANGGYACCQCDGEKIWDSVAKECVSCPSGGTKINCTTCAKTGTESHSWRRSDGCYGGKDSGSDSYEYCYTFNANQVLDCSE
ncbi:MAG: hypothetical protein J6U64_01325, partial [Alphaproteobacteria bacterium]|nr:hypothetical protein [Alphaproteobacteria bacterium]